jgi:hypothetical protein
LFGILVSCSFPTRDILLHRRSVILSDICIEMLITFVQYDVSPCIQ